MAGIWEGSNSRMSWIWMTEIWRWQEFGDGRNLRMSGIHRWQKFESATQFGMAEIWGWQQFGSAGISDGRNLRGREFGDGRNLKWQKFGWMVGIWGWQQSGDDASSEMAGIHRWQKFESATIWDGAEIWHGRNLRMTVIWLPCSACLVSWASNNLRCGNLRGQEFGDKMSGIHVRMEGRNLEMDRNLSGW